MLTVYARNGTFGLTNCQSIARPRAAGNATFAAGPNTAKMRMIPTDSD